MFSAVGGICESTAVSPLVHHPAIGPLTFIADASCTFMQAEYPYCRTGIWCSVATQLLMLLLVALMWWHLKRQNKVDDEGMVIQDDPKLDTRIEILEHRLLVVSANTLLG